MTTGQIELPSEIEIPLVSDDRLPTWILGTVAFLAGFLVMEIQNGSFVLLLN